METLIQLKSAMSHSYTIQPTVSAYGNLLSPLFIILKEINGTLKPHVQQTIFRVPIEIVAASASGKSTIEQIKMWLK